MWFRKYTLTILACVITLVMYLVSPKDLGCLTAAGGTLVAVLAFYFNANVKSNGKGNHDTGNAT